MFSVKVLVGAVAVVAVTGSAMGAGIGINFTGRDADGVDGSVIDGNLSLQVGAGTAGVLGTTSGWNNIATNATEGIAQAVTGDDAALAASVIWTAGGATSSETASGLRTSAIGNNGNLMDGYIEGNDVNSADVTVSGLLGDFVGDTYDVYIYLGDDAGGRNATLTFNADGGTGYTSNIFTGLFIAGTDYILYIGVMGDSFTASVSSADNSNRSGITGIEVVGTAIPEPGSLALLGLGGLALLRRRR